MDKLLDFLAKALSSGPLGFFVIPMVLCLFLIVHEQMRKQPRVRMLKTIWIFATVCFGFAVMAVLHDAWKSRMLVSDALEKERAASALREQQEQDALSTAVGMVYDARSFASGHLMKLRMILSQEIVNQNTLRTYDFAVATLLQRNCRNANAIEEKKTHFAGSKFEPQSCRTRFGTADLPDTPD
jgi:hypothetical protein